jgi:predicted ATPase/DNA-binding SARP family transcriptional activator/DNA-binding CsgD family transcriptional regulator
MSGSGHVSAGEKPEALRIWLFGGFRVALGARAIEKDAWRLRKAAALVKLLALAPGHRLHREQVMDLLWPELGRKAAANNLRNTLHAARAILDPAGGSRYLASEDDSLVLFPGGELWVNVDAFEEAAAGARRSGDLAAYRAAINLYAGDLLPEDRYEEWAEVRRRELRRMWLSLHVELVRAYEGRGEYEEGIETLQRALSEEPTNEELHAGLMRLYASSDRRGEALAQYERLRTALSGELDAQVSATTERLREEIAAGTLLPAQPTVTLTEEPSEPGKHNLPAPRTSFVGREHEKIEIERELTMTGLLMLTGAGGSGKTRLAFEVARDLIGAYPDGVWLVELASLTQGEFVAQTVAEAVGVHGQPGRLPTETLVDALRTKHMLLIMDNCEHLVDAVADLVASLLESCPYLRILATSREALGVSGEVIWPVSLLSVPDLETLPTVAQLEGYGSVRLFVDRARQRNPAFALRPENAQAVAQICVRLEGVPLAIELAAARIKVLSPQALLDRLSDRLKLLRGGPREFSERQRTLRSTIEWSFELLSEDEQGLFRRLSAFSGGWTLEAVEAVCSGGAIEQEDVLDLLGGLVDKSLVVVRWITDGAVRYGMLESIRQYAGEKLEESGEASEVRNRHATFFLELAEESEPQLAGPGQRLWVERLEAEHDNLREALSCVLEQGDGEQVLRLGAALWRFWHVRGYLSEGISWMERVLAEGETAASPVRVKALEGMGWLTQYQGDYKRARATYEEMLELSRELGDKGNVATALNSLGTVAAQRGDSERAKALLQENLDVIEELEGEGNPSTNLKRFHAFNLLGYLAIYEDGDYARGTTLWEQSLALAREVEDTDRIGTTLANLGHPALLQGDYEKAKSLSEEALEFAHELGNSSVEFAPTAWLNLGLATLGLGEHERARRSFEEALRMCQDMGRKPQVIEILEGLAGLAGALGEDIRAAHLWGAAQGAREDASLALPPGERALHEPYLVSAQSRLGEVAWEEALVKGQSMSLDEAVEYALAEEEFDRPAAPLPEQTPPGEPKVELTAREKEIAALVARGLTNRQIAGELSISVRTAGNHVAKILRKLGLRSRAQIAGWTAERRLRMPHPD